MNNKRMFAAMAVAVAAMIGWTLLVAYIEKQNPQWEINRTRAREQQEFLARQATTQVASTQPGPIVTTAPITTSDVLGITGASTSSVESPAAAVSGRSVASAARAQTSDLGSPLPNDKRFAMGVSLSPYGASIQAVTLNDYRKSVQTNDRYVFQTPSEVDPENTRPLATRSITVDGVVHSLINVPWILEHSDDASVTYRIDLTEGASPILRVRKTFTISPRRDGGDAEKGRQFEITITTDLENLTALPMKVATEFNGPSTLPRELDAGQDRNVVVAYDNSGTVSLTHHFVEYFTKEKPTMDLTRSDKSLPLLWVGSSSVYFNALLRPDRITKSEENQVPEYLQKVEGRLLNPDIGTPADRQVAVTVQTTEIELAGDRRKVTLPLRFYVGPRQRQLLNESYFAAFPLCYDATLNTSSGICSICTFQWLINILVWMLNIFHVVVRDWGVAIICLVCVVRLLLHPITKRSQINMAKMAKLSPEIQRLKDKHGDNKDELNKAMMGFYREHGMSQVMGCLPMFLQMPIWIALYSSLQSTFELRQAPFLYFFNTHFTWIKDLAKPDHLLAWQPIALPFGMHIDGFNLLPLLMGIVFFLQQKFTPKPVAMTPEQAQQQKMMMVLSTLLFPLFLYNGPSGLNLYILTSTTIGMIESKIIRDHIKERDLRESAGPVIIDVPARRDGKGKDVTPVEKRGFIARLMERVKDAQRKAEDLKKNRGK